LFNKSVSNPLCSASLNASGSCLVKEISIERDGLDKYNRTLAWVYLDSVLINKEIVEKGFGVVYEYNGTDCERVR